MNNNGNLEGNILHPLHMHMLGRKVAAFQTEFHNVLTKPISNVDMEGGKSMFRTTTEEPSFGLVDQNAFFNGIKIDIFLWGFFA